MRVTATIVLATAITVDAIAQNHPVAAIIALVIVPIVRATAIIPVHANAITTKKENTPNQV